jgi:hypothetical protein
MTCNFSSYDHSKQITTLRYDVSKAVMEAMERIYEYQDKLVLKNLPQDTLENLKERIELELLRRDKGEYSAEYTLAYHIWECKRREQGARL